MFRFHILGLLRGGKPLHGYALMKEYNRRTGRSHGAGYFYRQLSDLLAEGLVQSAPKPPGIDRRRAPYEITGSGEAAFDGWLTDIGREVPENGLDNVSRAIFFADAEPNVARAVLVRWRQRLRQEVHELEDKLDETQALPADLRHLRPTLIRRDLARLQADVEFLSEIHSLLEERSIHSNAASRSNERIQPAPIRDRRTTRRDRANTKEQLKRVHHPYAQK